MESREAALKALSEGKILTSTVTGLKYKLIDGLLHSKSSEQNDWTLSGLTFLNPPSWQNLFD